MITKKQIFESSKGKQSIEVRKRFVEQIMKIVNGMPDIEKNTKSFESNAKLLQSNLSENNLKHYFNSEKKSNSFSLFKFLRDAIDFYFEAKNSDENNAQKIYDKILKSKTNLKLDKSFKISSIEKNDAKIIFSLIENIRKKSISLLYGKCNENMLLCAKVIMEFIHSHWDFDKKYDWENTREKNIPSESDISDYENSCKKLLHPVEQNKRYFRDYKNVVKEINLVINFLENQKKFWVKYPDFDYQDYIDWLKLKKDSNSLNWNIRFGGVVGRLKECILSSEANSSDYWLYVENEGWIGGASQYFYLYGKTEHCMGILTGKYLSNLAETLSVEAEKPIKDRKPLKNLINKFLKDTPKELVPDDDVRKRLNNWLSKYKTKSLSLNDTVPNYWHLGRIHRLMYSYMFPTSLEVKECLSNLIETLSVETKKPIKNRKPLKKLIDKFLKDTPKELIPNNVRILLKDWLSKYNNRSLSINDKIPNLYVDSNLNKQLKKVHDLMYSYLLPPAFDARKIGKAETTEDIDAKTKNKENRRSLNLEI